MDFVCRCFDAKHRYWPHVDVVDVEKCVVQIKPSLIYFLAQQMIPILKWLCINLNMSCYIQYLCFFSRKFVNAYIDFPKPLIGLINGPAVGVSVTVLGLFDAVYATDKVCLYQHIIYSILKFSTNILVFQKKNKNSWFKQFWLYFHLQSN